MAEGNSIARVIRSDTIVQAILFIILGVVLLAVPGITLITIVYLVAGILLISGAISIAAYFRNRSKGVDTGNALVIGISLVIFAAVMFIFPAATASFFTVLLGLVLVFLGVTNIVRAFSLRTLGTGPAWVIGLVVSALVLIGGIVLIWNPFAATEIFVMVMGILLIVSGIDDLIIEVGKRQVSK